MATTYIVRYKSGAYLRGFTYTTWTAYLTDSKGEALEFASMSVAEVVAFGLDRGEDYDVIPVAGEQFTLWPI